jgi:hypothetical protein
MTYMFDGKQHIAVATGSAILAFGLNGTDHYSEGKHLGLRATRPRYTAQSDRSWRVAVYEMSSRLCGARRVRFAAAGRAVAT